MRGVPWKSQIAEGRVFELRSKSRRYPPPCALVIRAHAGYERAVAGVDQCGVIGHGFYHRSSNPLIYVDGLNIDQLTKRIARRRRDLERFDCYDLDLIRYGCALDFNGRIETEAIPLTRPALWTVFWLPAFDEDDYFWPPYEESLQLFSGAWYFEKHGGPRHLGYRYGHVWATRHSGTALRAIRNFLHDLRGDLIEQEVRVKRRIEDGNVITEEVRRECPPFGGRRARVVNMSGGNTMIYVGGF